jgi:fermentation-respiration switch protein FrsA (DUF1100 family)
VFTGPFTGVKEQVTGTYAAALAERGYVTLAFDHRNFGESEGEPRQHEDGPGKLRDLRDATSYLAGHAAVDPERIGCVGICLGGSYALHHTAFDPRVRALALVAGGYNDPADMRAGMGNDGYRQLLADLAAVAEGTFRTGEVSYLPAVSPDGSEAAMQGDEPWAYYGTERSASPGWVNRVTRLSIRELVTLDAASAAEFVSPTPTLLVHGTTDAYCPPEAARRIVERLGSPKDALWLATSNHIDLYDNPAFVEPAIERTAGWFDSHLREN